MHHACDVCVVGGGPAGAAAANRFARLGFHVLIVEAAAFPRRHVGESLPPSILPLLEQLGVRHDVEGAGFLRPRGATVRWAGNEHAKSSDEAGFQVDRGRFDALLLRAAQRAGADVWQPVAAAGPEHVGPFDWRVPVRGHEKYDQIRCRFVVDAAGRRGCLPGKRRRLSPPTLALWAYWSGIATADATTRVEAGVEHWYWGAPLPGGEFNATVFVDPNRCQRDGGDLDTLYGRLLSASKLLSMCVAGTRATPVEACTAAVSRVEQPVGSDWIKVGESAVTIDPLSSQGVTTAIAEGLQAAAVVNTILRHSEFANAAQTFYRDRTRETAEQNVTAAAEFYRRQSLVCATPFWRRRASLATSESTVSPVVAGRVLSPATRLRCSRELRVAPTPVLLGDMIGLELAAFHPQLPRPIAWLGGCRLADLLNDVDVGRTAIDVLKCWEARVPSNRAGQVLRWLWDKGLVTAFSARCSETTGNSLNFSAAGLHFQ